MNIKFKNQSLQKVFDARKLGAISLIEKMNPYLPDEIVEYFTTFENYDTLEEALKEKPEILEVI